jgi:voltage-gated potassium channel
MGWPISEVQRKQSPSVGAADRANRARRLTYLLLERSPDYRAVSYLVDIGLILLIFLNVIAVLLESVEAIRFAFATQFRYFELFSVTVFSIEYCLRMWACVEARPQNASQSKLRVRLRYAVTPIAIIDLIAVAPFYLGALGLVGPADMRVLRVMRILRLFKLSRYADSMNLFWDVLKENANNFAAAFGVLLIVMILAASGMYVLERDVQPEAFGSIPSAMWWAFVTLTTVGYGDVTPVTSIGKLFGATITVASIGIVALPAGLLASSFSARLRQNTERYRDVADEAAADGIISAEERELLERRRLELGLGEDLAAEILEDECARWLVGGHDRCPTCGSRIEKGTEAPERDR